MRSFPLVPALAGLSLAGCANQEPGPIAATAPLVVASESTTLTPQSELVCHKESPLGSSMIRTVCETEQSEADRLATPDRIRATLPNSSLTHPAVGSP